VTFYNHRRVAFPHKRRLYHAVAQYSCSRVQDGVVGDVEGEEGGATGGGEEEGEGGAGFVGGFAAGEEGVRHK